MQFLDNLPNFLMMYLHGGKPELPCNMTTNKKSKEQQTWRPSKIRKRQMRLHNVVGMNYIIHTNTLQYSCRCQKEEGEGAVQQNLEGCSRVRWVETSWQTWELLVAVDRAVWRSFVAAQLAISEVLCASILQQVLVETFHMKKSLICMKMNP